MNGIPPSVLMLGLLAEQPPRVLIGLMKGVCQETSGKGSSLIEKCRVVDATGGLVGTYKQKVANFQRTVRQERVGVSEGVNRGAVGVGYRI
jgi:hypothetical protein